MLTSLSPLDGRYAEKLDALRPVFSEYGLIKYRVRVEIAWLKALCAEPGIPEARALTADETTLLDDWAENFSEDDALRVKSIEAATNHDVKAVEYAIKEKLANTSLEKLAEFVHFACTSEDINNVAHALMLRDGLKILRETSQKLIEKCNAFAVKNAARPMLARTHGQPATPTTLGKETAVFVHRLQRQARKLETLKFAAKLNGAVGNYNAHVVAYPEVNWPAFARKIIEGLGLAYNPLTTQVEPRDGMAECFDTLARFNTIVLDLDRDFWQYISLGYLSQKIVKDEVGSSTMPHKVNPIDFENSEGNLGIANALLDHMARKLPVSRLQRDLSDSTVLRNMGVAFGHTLLAWQSTIKGLGKLEPNSARLFEDLSDAWELLSEPAQILMRKAGIANPYERLKELSRGKKITRETFHAFVSSLNLPPADKSRLLALTPAKYIGLAEKLAQC
ncbi:MAG: adenylosuccinate lyase [Kiritimatiellaeota bacterium]|nr:adenylosuccinate lyase [Kiritimatiellota bacterium]